MSHEGGLLLSFGGSSPALDSIIIRASDGVYIGKIDGVLGNTESPMAHVGHIDRKLDLNSLVGEEVTIRAKKPREERYPSSRDRDSRDRRDGGRGNFDRGSRDRRDGGRGNFDRGSRDRRDGGRGNFDRGSRGRNDSNDGDWDCPKCNNSNFARRTECNRCGEPRGSSGGRRDGGRGNFDRGSRDRRDGGRGNFDRGSRDRRDGGRRDGGRGNFDRGSRDRGATFAHNDWDCAKCNNSNFSFRRECNRCGEPRPGGGGERRERGRGNFDRGSRDRRDGGRRDGGRGNFDRGSRGRNDSNDGDWDCPKCNNSNFARRTECNRCGEPRSGGGGRRDGGRRDGGRGNFDRGSRDRRDGGRGNFDRGSRDRRDGGRRDFSNRDENRTKPKENNFRKSKGKRAGHAHNNAPKPIVPRKFSRNSDD